MKDRHLTGLQLLLQVLHQRLSLLPHLPCLLQQFLHDGWRSSITHSIVRRLIAHLIAHLARHPQRSPCLHPAPAMQDKLILARHILRLLRRRIPALLLRHPHARLHIAGLDLASRALITLKRRQQAGAPVLHVLLPQRTAHQLLHTLHDLGFIAGQRGKLLWCHLALTRCIIQRHQPAHAFATLRRRRKIVRRGIPFSKAFVQLDGMLHLVQKARKHLLTVARDQPDFRQRKIRAVHTQAHGQ